MYRFRIYTLYTCCLFSMWFNVGCTDNRSRDKDTIRIAIATEPKTLDPRFNTDAVGMRITSLLFSSLVRMGPQLKVVKDAAESYSYDKLTYKFVLKPGLKFHDGHKLGPEDILYSFKEYTSPKSPFRSTMGVLKDVAAVEKKGKIHVTLTLKYFSATFLNDLSSIKILPKHIVTKLGDDFARKPIGSGIFKIAERSINELKLERVENHPVRVAKSKYVTFKIVRDDTTRVLKLRSGEIDIVQNEIPPNKVKGFEGRDDYVVHKFPGLSVTYLLINLKDPVLAKTDVRRAIAKAINREEIIKYKLSGLAQKASSILTPANPFFYQAKTFSFDASGAIELIKKLNIETTPLTIKTSNVQSAVQNGQILAEQISKLGFDVDIESYEWGTFYSDIQAGNFQLATMRWIGATDPDIYRIAFHSSELPPKGRNRGHYVNAKLDNLLSNGIKIENSSARITHYREVQKIVQLDLPIIPLWYDKQVTVLGKSIKGYVPPLNGDYSPLYYVEKK